jgi:predicted MFS family arabinose efflux permease
MASAIQERPAALVDRRWLVLVVVAIAQLMVVLDSTVVNIALPSAQRSLGFPNGDRQWVVTAYALAFGSLLLVGGRLGDMFSRKWVFITGLAGFAVSSAIGGAAVSFEMLVAARDPRDCPAAVAAAACRTQGRRRSHDRSRTCRRTRACRRTRSGRRSARCCPRRQPRAAA